MIPAILFHEDPNDLPYYLTNRQGELVRVCFRRPAEMDRQKLRGPAWRSAVFHEVWPKLIGDGRTLKLTPFDGPQDRILGMIRLRSVYRREQFLQHSLLETAPTDRFAASNRMILGVGRVPVARLIVQSFIDGGDGKVVVRQRTGTERFYKVLGFQFVKPADDAMAIETEGADTSWNRCYPMRVNKSHQTEYDAAYVEAVEIIRQEWRDAGHSDADWECGTEAVERMNRSAVEAAASQLPRTRKPRRRRNNAVPIRSARVTTLE